MSFRHTKKIGFAFSQCGVSKYFGGACCVSRLFFQAAGGGDERAGDGRLKETVKQQLCLFPHAETGTQTELCPARGLT